MPAPLFRSSLKPGTRGVLDPVRSQQLDAARFGGTANGQPQPFAPMTPTVAPVRNNIFAAASATPAPAAKPASTLQPLAPEDLNLDPNSFGAQNAAANAGIYKPGSIGDQNAQANGTGYRAPQQTERANPLTGDNNIPMESTSTKLPTAPFVQRGQTTPAGTDASPTGQFTGGTGKFARSFGNRNSADLYHAFVAKLFPDMQGSGT